MGGRVAWVVPWLVAIQLLSSCAAPAQPRTRELLMHDPNMLIGEVSAGQFTDAQFRPRVSLTMPPRVLVAVDLPAWLRLDRENDLDLQYTSSIHIVRLSAVTASPITTPATQDANRRTVPRDVLRWIRNVRGLTVVDSPALVTRSGEVRRVEFSVDHLPRHRLAACPVACASLFISGAYPTAPEGKLISVYAGTKAAVGVMQVDGSSILLMVVAPQKTFDAYRAQADQILASLEFR